MAETNNPLINFIENQEISIFSYGQITEGCDWAKSQKLARHWLGSSEKKGVQFQVWSLVFASQKSTLTAEL